MSAQYLQALHAESEGSSYPSPGPTVPAATSSSSSSSAPSSAQQQKPPARSSVDLDSDSAFPALGASAAGKGKQATTSMPGWGAAATRSAASAVQAQSSSSSSNSNNNTNSNVKQAAAPPATAARDSLSLPMAEIQLTPPSVALQQQSTRRRGEEPPPTSLGEAASQTMKHHPTVKVEALTSKQAATFHFSGPTESAVLRAKADLISRIVKKISIVVEVPASTRAFIIGQKGRNLKTIQDESGAHIQLPPREAGDDQDVAAAAAAASDPTADDVQEPIFAITLTGSQFSCDQARARIDAIVAERASKVVHSANVPAAQFQASVWPFVQSEAEPMYTAEQVSAAYVPGHGLDVKGDSKDKVQRWAQELKKLHDLTKDSLKSASINIPKRQHRFLRDPTAIGRIFEKTGYVIELPPLDSPEESVILRGRNADAKARMEAMGEVLQLGESGEITTVNLQQYFTSADALHNACRYLNRQQHILSAALKSSGATVDLPTRQQVGQGKAELEVVAPSQDALVAAVDHVQNTVQLLSQPQRLSSVEVEPLHQKHLVPGGSKAKQVKALTDRLSGIDIVWPKDASTPSVLVAWPSAASTPALDEFKTELEKIISELGHVDALSFDVPAKFHNAIQGPNGTTLNVLVGEQKTTLITFGAGDKVTVRGPKKELPRVKENIEALVRRAEKENVETIHEASFDIESRFVGYIVGKNGAGVNKLNSELGVRVQFEDPSESPAPASADGTQVIKKKKSSKPRVHVTIRGRQENVDEAMRRIKAHAERVADETTATVTLPTNVDRRVLIGKQGNYVQRLESKYEVRVLFPKAEDSDSAITIRGPRKGVEGAKKELSELIEYEVENSQQAVVKVPVKAVSRIVGRGGASVNQIMAETGAAVDVESHDSSSSGNVNVTLKGTKEAVGAAKKVIENIAKEAQDEAVLVTHVAKAMQPGLIGRGGQNLKDMIVRCGGPTDARSQGAMVRLPRPEDPATDVITLRGKRAVIEKLQKEIESYVADVESRIVYGVAIPQPAHANIIGRGGVGINELSAKHNVRVLFPGWKDNTAAASGEVVNASELGEVDPTALVRILGTEASCKAAAEEMMAKQASSSARASRSATPSATHSRTVQVPAQFHRIIADGGRFFRRHIPPRVNVDHGSATLPAALPKPKAAAQTNGTSARIDADDDEEDVAGGSILESWEMHALAGESASEPIPWNITGQNEENVAKAEAAVEAALQKVADWSHVAYARVGRPNMPRVIGKGGAGLENLRVVSRGDVEALGRKDADTISITGPEDGLLAAKAELEKLERR